MKPSGVPFSGPSSFGIPGFLLAELKGICIAVTDSSRAERKAILCRLVSAMNPHD